MPIVGNLLLGFQVDHIRSRMNARLRKIIARLEFPETPEVLQNGKTGDNDLPFWYHYIIYPNW